MWNWPWLLDIINHSWQWWSFNLTMVNHCPILVKTLPDHGQPWFDQIHPTGGGVPLKKVGISDQQVNALGLVAQK